MDDQIGALLLGLIVFIPVAGLFIWADKKYGLSEETRNERQRMGQAREALQRSSIVNEPAPAQKTVTITATDPYGDISYEFEYKPKAICERFEKLLVLGMELREKHGVKIRLGTGIGEPSLSLYHDIEIITFDETVLLGEFVCHVECGTDTVRANDGYRTVHKIDITADWSIADDYQSEFTVALTIPQVRSEHAKFLRRAGALGTVNSIGRPLRKGESPPPFPGIPGGKELSLTYDGGRGNKSTRRVKDITISSYKLGSVDELDYFDAYCATEKKTKTFRTDRVVSLQDGNKVLWPKLEEP